MKIMMNFGQAFVAVSDKSDGNMKIMASNDETRVMANQQKFLAGAGLDAEQTFFVKVSYDTADFCQFAVASDINALALEQQTERCDGLVTNKKHHGIFLPLADCVGVVLYHAASQHLMVVHCGRQTVLQNGAERAVQYLAEIAHSSPESFSAWLSPAAGPGNYPLHELGGIGLHEAVTQQLTHAGVKPEMITRSDIDTTTAANYFSHSQGDRLDRFAIVAAIRDV